MLCAMVAALVMSVLCPTSHCPTEQASEQASFAFSPAAIAKQVENIAVCSPYHQREATEKDLPPVEPLFFTLLR